MLKVTPGLLHSPNLLARRTRPLSRPNVTIFTKGAMMSASWVIPRLFSCLAINDESSATTVVTSNELRTNLEMFTQDQGQAFSELFTPSQTSSGAVVHNMMQGKYTRIVLWKQGVKSGWSEYQVWFRSHKGPWQRPEDIMTLIMTSTLYWNIVSTPQSSSNKMTDNQVQDKEWT